jgi:hypothetical protein
MCSFASNVLESLSVVDCTVRQGRHEATLDVHTPHPGLDNLTGIDAAFGQSRKMPKGGMRVSKSTSTLSFMA